MRKWLSLFPPATRISALGNMEANVEVLRGPKERRTKPRQSNVKITLFGRPYV